MSAVCNCIELWSIYVFYDYVFFVFFLSGFGMNRMLFEEEESVFPEIRIIIALHKQSIHCKRTISENRFLLNEFTIQNAVNVNTLRFINILCQFDWLADLNSKECSPALVSIWCLKWLTSAYSVYAVNLRAITQ